MVAVSLRGCVLVEEASSRKDCPFVKGKRTTRGHSGREKNRLEKEKEGTKIPEASGNTAARKERTAS